MKVKKLTLTNIGPFNKVELDLHSGVNIITGPNASGKSLLTKAPYFILLKVAGRENSGSLNSYCRKNATILATFETAIAEMPPELFLSSATDDPGGLIFKQVFSPMLPSQLVSSLQSFRQLKGKPTFVYISPERGSVHSERLQTINNTTWRLQDTGTRFNHLRSLFQMLHDQTDEMDEKVRQIVQNHFTQDGQPLIFIKKSRTVPNTPNLATDVHSLGSTHEVASAASGCMEILFIITETALLKDSLIIIDEPELHLHPLAQDMMSKYLDYLASPAGGSNQVIVATHSLSIIYGHPTGKVFNLRRENGGGVAEPIIEDNIPCEPYTKAIKQLGYYKDQFLEAITFWKKYHKLHPDLPPSGGWIDAYL